MTRSLLIIVLIICLAGCEKKIEIFYPELDRSISITDKIAVDNGVGIRDPVFNYVTYDNFLSYLSSSDHFIIVPLKDFKKTNSKDKVVIFLRHDIDENLNASVKFAYREHKYGIKSTYFVLHTAKYYGKKAGQEFIQNDNVVYFLQKIQDSYGHEIGIHNDLVTLQVMYEIPSRKYLKNELAYLREDNIQILGTSYHGSPYCYLYKYSNAYFWEEYPNTGRKKKGYKTIKIEKDSLANYSFEYEVGMLGEDYFFADNNTINGRRWNMSMVNLDTIKPGEKVIILLHPQHWD